MLALRVKAWCSNGVYRSVTLDLGSTLLVFFAPPLQTIQKPRRSSLEVQHETLAEIVHVASLNHPLIRVEVLVKDDASHIAGVASCVVVFHH